MKNILILQKICKKFKLMSGTTEVTQGCLINKLKVKHQTVFKL